MKPKKMLEKENEWGIFAPFQTYPMVLVERQLHSLAL